MDNKSLSREKGLDKFLSTPSLPPGKIKECGGGGNFEKVCKEITNVSHISKEKIYIFYILLEGGRTRHSAL